MSNIDAWNFRIDEGLWRQKPLASWKAIPMTSRTLVPSSTTSIPITLAVPDDGFRIVHRIIRSVVLPDPLGPRITINDRSYTQELSSEPYPVDLWVKLGECTSWNGQRG